MEKDSFEQKLFAVLKQNPDFLSTEGEVLKDRVIDSAYKAERKLIELLLENAELKKKFFSEIQGHWVFNINDFVMFVQDKHFLNDSYTNYKNKIGLTIDSKFFNERKEVALVWPFKDTVLEGGMTKEDQKKKEIFFNEILAQDEIDKLLAPKVLTNWKRYTIKGEEEVKELKRDENGTIKENLIIKGNNLLALHALKEQFRGKVKLIYIDPPYNREEDKSTFYNDNFNHSTWLTFMKNRLEIGKTLLRDDGVIFVQCDDNEQAYLKVLMDEVFGQENFLSTIAYQRSGVAGLGQGGSFVANVTEYINVFAKYKGDFKSKDLVSEVPLDLKHMKRYNAILEDSGERVLFREFISKSTGEIVKVYKHKKHFIKKIPLADFEKNKGEILKIYKNNFDKIFRLNVPQEENSFQWDIINSFDDESLFSVEYLVSRGKSKGEIVTNFYFKKQLFAWLKSSGDASGETISKTNKMSDFWTNEEIPKADLANEGGVKLKRGKKPEQLLKRIISISTDKGDLVLDYHLGSGTTCAVAHKMNRKYIGIEQLDYGENDGVVRLNNVIKGDQTGISKYVNWQKGDDFVYCELMKYNESFVEEIQNAKDIKVLLKIWEQMKEKAFFKHNFEMQEFEKDIEEFKKLDLKKQKQVLFSVLDKNQLYVNYSEIEDKKFKVEKKDKEINKEFYGK